MMEESNTTSPTSWRAADAAAARDRQSSTDRDVRTDPRFLSASSGRESAANSEEMASSGRRFGSSAAHTHGENYEHHDGGQDEEEDEEDDDDVRRSWTTEKEPVAVPFVSSARFPFREELEQEEDGEDYDADDAEGASDESYGLLGWITQQLRRLDRRRSTDEDGEIDDHDDGGVDEETANSVRDALRLLNGRASDGDNRDEEDEDRDEDDEAGDHDQRGDEEGEEEDAEQWQQQVTADGNAYYFDIVQEAMGSQWERDGGDHDHSNSHEEQDDDEEKDEYQDGKDEYSEEEEVDESRTDQADEWLEAFTAKGRVYYYNRRTRESSWTKPESVVRKEALEASGLQQVHDQKSSSETDNQRDSAVHDPPAIASSDSHTSQDPPQTPALSKTHTSLFCCFCGSPMADTDGLHTHLHQCESLQFHKSTASPLYAQFQQMLVLLSEDTSLRAMHYASSSLDAIPHNRGEPVTQQSVRESLALLRVKHRSSIKPPIRRASVDDRVPVYHVPASQPVKKAPVQREPLSVRAAKHAAATAQLNTETCRHCGRSFAEGRLAKHEAVCPRVFGSETAWGRGAVSVLKPPMDSSDQRQQQELLHKKRHAKLKHTLALSFQEHQNSLVQCPCCRRKFAPSGAQQHIDICKSVTHRPRNTVPLLRDFAIAS